MGLRDSFNKAKEKAKSAVEKTFETVARRGFEAEDDNSLAARASRGLIDGFAFAVGGLAWAGKVYQDKFTKAGRAESEALAAMYENTYAPIRRIVETALLPSLQPDTRALADSILKKVKDPVFFFRAVQEFGAAIQLAPMERSGMDWDHQSITMESDGAVKLGDQVLFTAAHTGWLAARDAKAEDGLLIAAFLGHAIRNVPELFEGLKAAKNEQGSVTLTGAPDPAMYGYGEGGEEAWRADLARRWSNGRTGSQPTPTPQP